MKKILFILLFALSAQLISAASNDSYFFQRAEEAYQNEDLDLCLHYCLQGVERNAKDAKCWAVIAEIYSKRKYARYAEALEAADKALAAFSKKEVSWRAFTHNIRGNIYYKIEDLPAAKQAYMEAVALEPENTSFIYELADVCYDLKQYEEAISYYERIERLSPKTVYIYGYLARAHYMNGNTSEAQRYCNLTNALSSNENCMSHQVLSLLALDREDHALACREAVRAMFCEGSWWEGADTLNRVCPDLLMAGIRYEVDNAPTDVETNATAAYCTYMMHQYMETLYYLHKKMEQSDSPESIHKELAHVYDDVDAFDEAIQYYELTVKNDSDAQIWWNYATTVRHSGDYARAEQLFRRALQDSPTEGAIYYSISLCRKEAGDYNGALLLLDTAQVLMDEESVPAVLYRRAELYRLMGDAAKERQTLQMAQRMRKADSDQDTYYMIDALMGGSSKLIECADSMMHERPKDPSMCLTLANAFAILKDKPHTMQMLKRFYDLGEYAMKMPHINERYAFLQGDPEFETMMAHYDSLRVAALEELHARLGERDTLQGVTELPFTREGGVCRVKCTLNGLPLYFVFDTGAADVSISSVEANFMLKNGYLTNADFMGKQNYVTATGEIHEGTIINLREVRVGDVVLRDIKASVIKNQSAPLLLGQSCFRRFGTVEVDNNAQVIRLIAQ